MCDPINEEWTAADDAIEEVREIRRQISARFDDDLDKLFDHYVELEKRHAGRLWDSRTRYKQGKSAA